MATEKKLNLSAAEAAEKEAKLNAVLAEYRQIPGTLISVLQEAQRIYGWLPLEVMQKVAAGLSLPLSQVVSVESFYSFFNNEPYGKTIIRLCTSAPCHVKGAQETLAAFEKELGIPVGGTTPDGAFTLLSCDCLGACDRSPAVLVGETLFGPVTAEEVPAFLENLKKEKKGGEK